MVNGAPILDDTGNCKGALATFDDVTKVEEQNEQLQTMLGKLKKSRDEVRRKNKELEILATRDPLTGCFNRRAFFETFEIEFSSVKRYGHDLSCVMFDIDHFKNVNDTHGHAAGDMVLKGIADVLRSLLRKTDTIGRYGGEEFCIILPNIDIDGATQAAERFRRGIESYDFSGIPITSSFGVSIVDPGISDVAELIDRADKALYAAKEGGRNRVVNWKQLNSGGDKEGSEVKAAVKKVTTNEETTRTPAEAALNLADAGRETPGQAQTGSIDKAGSIKHDSGYVTPGQGDIKEEVNAESAGSERSKLSKTASAISGKDNISEDDFCYPTKNKDALGFVRGALNDSDKKSGSMGFHASLNKKGDTAIQLNKNGGWGDGGKLDTEKRSHPNSISRAANVLKGSLKGGTSKQHPLERVD